MTKKSIVAAALIAISSVSGLAQDAQKGKTLFNVCLVCHAIGRGAQNKIGPELNGLDGRKAGTAPNFDYSDANSNSGIVVERRDVRGLHKKSSGEDPRNENDFRRRQERAAG
jgi:cytochrome c